MARDDAAGDKDCVCLSKDNDDEVVVRFRLLLAFIPSSLASSTSFCSFSPELAAAELVGLLLELVLEAGGTRTSIKKRGGGSKGSENSEHAQDGNDELIVGA